MREKDDVLIGMCFDLAFITGKKIVADLNPARDRVAGGLVNDNADTAKVYIPVIGDELESRRSNIDGEIFLDNRFITAKKIPPGTIPSRDP